MALDSDPYSSQPPYDQSQSSNASGVRWGADTSKLREMFKRTSNSKGSHSSPQLLPTTSTSTSDASTRLVDPEHALFRRNHSVEDVISQGPAQEFNVMALSVSERSRRVAERKSRKLDQYDQRSRIANKPFMKQKSEKSKPRSIQVVPKGRAADSPINVKAKSSVAIPVVEPSSARDLQPRHESTGGLRNTENTSHQSTTRQSHSLYEGTSSSSSSASKHVSARASLVSTHSSTNFFSEIGPNDTMVETEAGSSSYMDVDEEPAVVKALAMVASSPLDNSPQTESSLGSGRSRLSSAASCSIPSVDHVVPDRSGANKGKSRVADPQPHDSSLRASRSPNTKATLGMRPHRFRPYSSKKPFKPPLKARGGTPARGRDSAFTATPSRAPDVEPEVQEDIVLSQEIPDDPRVIASLQSQRNMGRSPMSVRKSKRRSGGDVGSSSDSMY